MRQFSLLLAPLFILAAIAHGQLVTPSYTVTDIGVLPGFQECRANSIDAAGDVVGYCLLNRTGSTQLQHAFRYHAGKMVDLGALYNPALATEALYSNIEGDVILAQSTSIQYPSLISANEHPVLYRNGRFTPITFPHGGTGSVNGLNDLGQIAGNYTANGVLSAFVIEPNGVLITLRPTSSGPVSVQGITEFGQVYGNIPIVPAPTDAQLITQYPDVFHAFTYPDGYVQPVDFTLAIMKPEFPALTAFTSKAVLASAYSSPETKGIVYGNGATYEMFNEQGYTACNGTYSVAFNNVGHFVEVSQVINTPGPFQSYAPVLHAGNKVINLVNAQNLTGAVYSVTGINDLDTVVGYLIGNDDPIPLVNWGIGFYPEINPFLYINGKVQPIVLHGTLPFKWAYMNQLLGVTDFGNILATGLSSPGYQHTFILKPVAH